MTVEAAIALGTLVLVVAASVGAVAAVLASVRCVDAARELARAATRGDPEGGRTAAARLAPGGARMDVRTDGDAVVVVVTAEPVGVLPLTVSGTASGILEPGVQRAATPPIPDSPPADTPPADTSPADAPTGTAPEADALPGDGAQPADDPAFRDDPAPAGGAAPAGPTGPEAVP